MPVGAQLNDGVVQMHANIAAHGHHHGLAPVGGIAGLKVRHDVQRHAVNACLCAHHFFQCGPFAFGLGLLVFFLILGQLIHFIIQQRQHLIVEFELGQAAFVVDGHRRPILLGLLHVVDVDMAAKHRLGVFVAAAHRRTGEGYKRGLRQRIAQVLGVACLVGQHLMLWRGKLRLLRHRLAIGRQWHAGGGHWILGFADF